MTTQEFIDAIKGMTVLELNDLVKACEEEFGVSAAAGVVVAAGAAGAEGGAEKDEFDVEQTVRVCNLLSLCSTFTFLSDLVKNTSHICNR